MDMTNEIICFLYLQDDLYGQALLDVVFGRLNLIETAYFGLRHLDDENQTVYYFCMHNLIKIYNKLVFFSKFSLYSTGWTRLRDFHDNVVDRQTFTTCTLV